MSARKMTTVRLNSQTLATLRELRGQHGLSSDAAAIEYLAATYRDKNGEKENMKEKFYEISYSISKSKENYNRAYGEMNKAEIRPIVKDYKQKLMEQYPDYKVTGVKVRQR